MHQYDNEARVPVYVASALSGIAGSAVAICDSHGKAYDHKFVLRDVPEHVSLADITRHLVNGKGLDEGSLTHVEERAGVLSASICSGRARLPHSTVAIQRVGHRVHVEVRPFEYSA